MIDDFILELPFLKYDKNLLIDYMKEKSVWINEGYINDYFRPKEYNPLLSSIYDQIPEFEMNLGRTYFGELKPNVFLKPHVDAKRKAGINIPLIGDFSQSPIRFHDKIGKVIYTHIYNNVPTIINSTILHSVQNSNSHRYILSFSLYLEWTDIKQVVKKYLNQSRGREVETH
jgi:hypothetical protein